MCWQPEKRPILGINKSCTQNIVSINLKSTNFSLFRKSWVYTQLLDNGLLLRVCNVSGQKKIIEWVILKLSFQSTRTHCATKIVRVTQSKSITLYWRLRGGVAQWVARLTRNVQVVGSSPIKDPRCFLEQETLPLLVLVGYRNGFECEINKLRALWKIDLNVK